MLFEMEVQGTLAFFESLQEVYCHLGPGTRVELVQVGLPCCDVDELGFPMASDDGLVNGVSD